ncbi:MAG: YybH family protein [Burkholderiales bacterium]
MKKPTYTSPQDAETAFYEALEAGNLDAMMDVWAEDEELVCVHPGGPRLVGYDQVRASWAKMLGSGQRLQVRIADPVYMQSMMISVHSLHEIIAAQGQPRGQAVAAINVYLRTGTGWRMIAHHASPVPQVQQRQAVEAPEAGPKILH